MYNAIAGRRPAAPVYCSSILRIVLDHELDCPYKVRDQINSKGLYYTLPAARWEKLNSRNAHMQVDPKRLDQLYNTHAEPILS